MDPIHPLIPIKSINFLHLEWMIQFVKLIKKHKVISTDAVLDIGCNDGILLKLNNGSIHENPTENDEYRKTFFDIYKIAIPFDELGYNEKQNCKSE